MATAETERERAAEINRSDHNRRPGVPQQQCVALNRINGKRCRRWATSGRGRLCKTHKALAQSQNLTEAELTAAPSSGPSIRSDEPPASGPEPGAAGLSRAGISTKVKGQAAKAGIIVDLKQRGRVRNGQPTTRLPATTYVLNEQAKAALAKLGEPFDPSKHFDPKVVLLDMVNSAWQQQRIWVAMLATVDEADWQQLGVTPIPGNPASSKGARIEAIQKYLSEATKVASRISSSAISAGIEERLVRLAEEQQIMIADTVRAALVAGVAALIKSFHLGPEAETRAIEAAVGAAANHLRQLAAGGTDVVQTVESVVSTPPSRNSQYAANRKARQAAEGVPAVEVIEGEFTEEDPDA